MARRILVTALLLSPLAALAQPDDTFPFREATVAQLQAQMAAGRLTSEQLTRAYIDRIHA
jgi:Asp-tRNA(Asn)/Glu-tRNA(Gln) amidotransferase A subunit family amidase